MKENCFEQKKPYREEGFSLVEVMLAVSILAIGMFSISALQVNGIKWTSTSGSMADAAIRASNQFETLMSLPYTAAECHEYLTDRDSDGGPGLMDVGIWTSDHSRQEGRYDIFWNIADGQLVGSDSKSVTVIVKWEDRGSDRKVILEETIPRR